MAIPRPKNGNRDFEHGIWTIKLFNSWLQTIMTKIQKIETNQFKLALSMAVSMTDKPIRQITGEIVRGPTNLRIRPIIPREPMMNSTKPAIIIAPWILTIRNCQISLKVRSTPLSLNVFVSLIGNILLHYFLALEVIMINLAYSVNWPTKP